MIQVATLSAWCQPGWCDAGFRRTARAGSSPFPVGSPWSRRPEARPAIPDAGSSHLDGPEYSPDGEWLYFNTEEYASGLGHAQLARMPAEGGGVEHLVESETVDWFPHLSPDGNLGATSAFLLARLDIRPT
jgi:hypothetical protein